MLRSLALTVFTRPLTVFTRPPTVFARAHCVPSPAHGVHSRACVCFGRLTAALVEEQHVDMFEIRSVSGKTRLLCCTATLREATQWIALIDYAKVGRPAVLAVHACRMPG